MKKKVLMVAFEFPPCNGASVQRIFSVYKGFIEHGYDVDVVTAKPHAYAKTSNDLFETIPSEQLSRIHRTMALDAQRHLSIKGKHIGVTATPDRWAITWVPSASKKGKQLVKKAPYDIIWSSAPMASVHFIASRLVSLHRKTHSSPVLWVADYRDPITYLHREGYRTKTRKERIEASFDEAVMRDANVVTAATKGIIDLYKDCYPDAMESMNTHVMSNGFMADFMETQRQAVQDAPHESGGMFLSGAKNLYYAGVLYTDGRDPVPVLRALSRANSDGKKMIALHFQGSGNGEEYRDVITELGLQDVVFFHPGVSLTHAVRNMLCADGLLLIQDEKFNQQIPGKLYEYLASNTGVVMKTPHGSASSIEGGAYDNVWQGYSEDDMVTALRAWRGNEEKVQRDVSEFSREKNVAAMIENIQNLTEGGYRAANEDDL